MLGEDKVIKAFVFDLGNVIVPFEIQRGLNAFAKYSEFGESVLLKKFNRYADGEKYHRGEISSLEFFEQTCKRFRLEMTYSQFKKAWNSIFLQETLISEDFILSLKQNFSLVILSDTNRIHVDFIRRKFSILKHFDALVLSHEVGALKPSPKMYRMAIEKAGCLARECFLTDDLQENIEGAISSGMRAVRFTSPQEFERELIIRGIIKKGSQ